MRLYRYITENGEGSFSATRRHITKRESLLERAITVVEENTYWLFFPYLKETNLEFYWTEEGRRRFEHTFLPVQEECLERVCVFSLNYHELPGDVVYEDPYQVGIRAREDKSHLPNPYLDRGAFSF